MIRVRDAEPGDLAALCALRQPRIGHERKLELARSGAVRFLLAVDGESIVGFASLFLSNPDAGPAKSHLPKLSDHHVDPSQRRRGVGARLVVERESIARVAGFDALYVSVDPIQNGPWLEFFLRRGYEPLQPAPYRKVEQWIGADGGIIPVEAWRQDLVLRLR